MATGKHGSARLDGAAESDKVDLNARIDVPQAQVLDPRIAGKAEAVAALTGALAHLDATLKATLGEGRLLDRPTSGLTLEARLSDITGLIDAEVSVRGDIDRQPLNVSAHLARRADGGWTADNLALSLASVRLTGHLTTGADQLANGELNFSAANLDDLSPLVLTKLGGALQAKLGASTADGRQDVAIVAGSDRLSVGPTLFEGLKIDLTVGDLWGARILSGVASLSRGDDWRTIDFRRQADGDRPRRFERSRSQRHDSRAGAEGARTAVRRRRRPASNSRASARRAPAKGWRSSVRPPSSIETAASTSTISRSRVGAGRLSLSGHAGSTLDLRATASALPLTALDLAAPGLGLSGVADGEATIKGAPDEPSGDWRVRLKGVSMRRRCATPRCRRWMSRAPDASARGARRSTSPSVRAAPTPFARQGPPH